MESRRESAKQERKNKILTAARSLLDEKGLSMRALAEEAGVSIKTPYNLFGSKHNLLASLMDNDLTYFKSRVNQVESLDFIEKIYDSLDLAMDIYRSEEHFYRGLFIAAVDTEHKSLTPVFFKPRMLFWKDLILSAIAEGKVSSETDATIFSKNIINQFSGCLQEWILGLVTTDTMHNEVGYGLSLSLFSVVEERERERVYKRIRHYQKALAKACN